MEKSTINNFLWITVTVIVMLSLIALASPFGVYIRNNIETFTGDYIEQGDPEAGDAEEVVCKLIINYNVPAEAGTTLPSVHRTLRKNEQYSIVSPSIPGYEPSMEIVTGVITQDPTEITVTYSRGKYSIKYVLNEGQWTNNTYKPPEMYTFKTDTTLPTAANITKQHYTFDGWYETKDFSTPKVTSVGLNDYGDKIYYAKWKPVQYEINYVFNDSANERASWGDSLLSNGVLKDEYKYYTYGQHLKLPTEIHRFGFTFDGWTEDPNGTDISMDRTQITSGDSGNITLYAKWRRNVYEIRYHLTFTRPDGTLAKFTILDTEYTVITVDGKTETRTGIPTQYTYGEKIILPNNLYYPGYQGFSKSEVWFNKETQQITISGGVVSYYPYAPNELVQKTQISPSTVGFVSGETSSSLFDHTDLDLYVKPIPNQYYIHFDANKPTNTANVTGTMADQLITYDEATTLRTNTFSCSGYKFIGWNTQPDGSGMTYIMHNGQLKLVTNIDNKAKIYNMTIEHLDVVTLYAQWEAIESNVKINYHYQNINNNNYTLSYTETLNILSDADLNMASLMRINEKEGFTFSHMTAKGNTGGTKTLTAPEYATTILADGSRVIDVYYTRNSYTLKFIVDNLNAISSATTTIGSTNKTINSSTANSITVSVKYGQTVKFTATHKDSWKLQAFRSSDSKYQSVTSPFEIVMPASDVTITMTSVENAGFVNFDPNCPEAPAPTPAEIQTVYYTYGKAFGTLPSVSRGHYRFVGWYTARTGGTKVNATDIFTTAKNGVTYYARWARLEPNSDEHEFESSVITEATCLTTGKIRWTCKVCGAYRDETTPALGHIEGTPYVVTVGTCYQEEEKAINCTRDVNGCGKQRIDLFKTGKYGPHNTSDAAQCCCTHELSWDGKYGCSGNKNPHLWNGGRETLCGRDGKCNVKVNKDMWCAAHGTRERHTFHCGRYGQKDKGKSGRVDGLAYVGKITWTVCEECSKKGT